MAKISKINSPILEILQYGNIRETIIAMENPIVFLNSEDFQTLRSQCVVKARNVKYLRFEKVRIEEMAEIKMGLFYIMDCKGYDVDLLRISLKMYLIKQNKE